MVRRVEEETLNNRSKRIEPPAKDVKEVRKEVKEAARRVLMDIKEC
jgi:hypothetical protein